MNFHEFSSTEEFLNFISSLNYVEQSKIRFTIDLPDKFKTDSKVIVYFIKEKYLCFSEIPSIFHQDRDVMLAYAQRSDDNLIEIPETWRNDESFVKEVLLENPIAYKYASEKVRLMRDIAILAFNPSKNSYNNLKYVPSPLNEDRELIKAALKSHSQAYLDIPKKLKSDKEFINLAIEHSGGNSFVFQALPETCRDDESIAYSMIAQDNYSYAYASERLRDIDSLFQIAVTNRGENIKYASARIRDCNNLVLLAVKKGGSLEFISDRLKNDKDFIVNVLQKFKERSWDFQHLPPQIKNDPDVIAACIGTEEENFNASCYKDFPENFRTDRNTTYKMSFGNDFDFRAVPENLRTDRAIIKNAIKSDYNNFKYLPDEILADFDFLKTLFQINKYILHLIPDNLRNHLFLKQIVSAKHYDAQIKLNLVLGDTFVKDRQRSVKYCSVIDGNKEIVIMDNFPAIEYEEDGPVGSYLTVRYVNNFMLSGHFVLFVRLNSGKETTTNYYLQNDKYMWRDSKPQESPAFLNHEVYLIPCDHFLNKSINNYNCNSSKSYSNPGDENFRVEFNNLIQFPRLYYGPNFDYLPKGIRIFNDANSFNEAFTVLSQETIYENPSFRKIDEFSLEAIPQTVEELFGAARVFVDGFGWRFLIPNSKGALEALNLLKTTTNHDDWVWIKNHDFKKLSQFQLETLLSHFTGTVFHEEVSCFIKNANVY